MATLAGSGYEPPIFAAALLSAGAAMLYYLLKGLLRPALRVFYAQATDAGPEALPETGPLVVVANHPNTLMDPLLVGMLWRRQLHFLTNSRFFTSVGGWVLRASGAIPLYRQEDHAATAGERPAGGLTNPQRAARNDASFRASFELLSAGGALLIFPEGSSVLTRRLRPVKSGAARIALGAEARHDWQLGVRIVPVGLNYAAADRFRSRVYRRVGPPICVADYRTRYEANPSAAIRALTAEVRRALDQQLHAPRTDDDEALVRVLEALLPVLLPLLPLRADGPAAPASSPTAGQEFALVGALRHTLHWLDGHDPARGQALRQRLLDYQQACHRAGMAPGAPLDLPPPGIAARAGLTRLLGGPVWAWGILHHGLAYGLTAYLARRLTREAEFTASLTMVLGMVLLPLFYGVQTWLVWRFTHSGTLTAGYLVGLPITGWGALAYARGWAAWRHERRVRALGRQHPQQLAALRAEHAALLADLMQALTEWQRAEPPAAAPEKDRPRGGR